MTQIPHDETWNGKGKRQSNVRNILAFQHNNKITTHIFTHQNKIYELPSTRDRILLYHPTSETEAMEVDQFSFSAFEWKIGSIQIYRNGREKTYVQT
jgi:hypothetical protein